MTAGEGGRRLAGAVFDCDGVLVNSEELAWLTWAQALRAHGYEITPDEIRARTGITRSENLAWFHERAGIPDIEAFRVGLEEAMGSAFAASLATYPDAVAALEALHGDGVPIAVASNSSHQEVEGRLASTGLRRFVNAVVGADEVDRPKPAPDVYTEAVRRLGTAPDATVAIEDSPHGVQAAKAAGLLVVAVVRLPGVEGALAAADLVTDEVDVGPIRGLVAGR